MISINFLFGSSSLPLLRPLPAKISPSYPLGPFWPPWFLESNNITTTHTKKQRKQPTPNKNKNKKNTNKKNQN